MASMGQARMKEMEEEMNRFEQEILANPNAAHDMRGGPRRIIGSNTFRQALAAQQAHGDDHDDEPPQKMLRQAPPPHAQRQAPPPHAQRQAPPPHAQRQAPPPHAQRQAPPSLNVTLACPPPPPPPPDIQASTPTVNIPLAGVARAPPPPPPGPAPSGPPPGVMRPPSFVPHQLRHRPPPPRPPYPPMGMPPRPPHMGGPPMRPPPMMGGPPRGPPGGPPMGPPPGAMGPPSGGGGGPPMGPPPGGFPPQFYNAGPRPAAEPAAPPSVTIEKPKVVYSAPPVRNTPKPTESSDDTSGATISAGPSLIKKPEESVPESAAPGVVAPGIELNIPAQEIAPKPMINPEALAMQIDMQVGEIMKKEKKEKKKKYVRTAAGTLWEDNSLADWDNDDFRIFCGDIGNEVTDEVLARAFSRFPSFQKAKVVRDKKTNKTRGYGFVSFKDPNDFVKAMREMNGKYVGNRPIKLRKSTWKERQVDVVKKKNKEKKRLGFR